MIPNDLAHLASGMYFVVVIFPLWPPSRQLIRTDLANLASVRVLIDPSNRPDCFRKNSKVMDLNQIVVPSSFNKHLTKKILNTLYQEDAQEYGKIYP